MARLSKISTRQGDDGLSSVLGGARLAKSAPIFAALGDVDELNCQIGVVLAQQPSSAAILQAIQQDLFDLGALLAGSDAKFKPAALSFVEATSSQINATLPALAEFILPTGDMCTAGLQLSRSICRRAERSVVACNNPKFALAIKYLNRLSDLLFNLARQHAAVNNIELSLWRG